MTTGPSFKRNEREGFKTTKELAKPSRHHRHNTHTSARLPPKPIPEPPISSNQLLAGYLANEFLTKGSILGQPWDPTRAEESFRFKPARKSEPAKERDEPDRKEKRTKECQRYKEVADLLKMDQIHLPGIVNPTQLSGFLQLGQDVLFT